MSQTFILTGGQAIGVAGMIADSSEIRDILSGFNKDGLGQQIPFGYAVMHTPGNTDERAYSLPTGGRWIMCGAHPAAASSNSSRSNRPAIRRAMARSFLFPNDNNPAGRSYGRSTPVVSLHWL